MPVPAVSSDYSVSRHGLCSCLGHALIPYTATFLLGSTANVSLVHVHTGLRPWASGHKLTTVHRCSVRRRPWPDRSVGTLPRYQRKSDDDLSRRSGAHIDTSRPASLLLCRSLSRINGISSVSTSFSLAEVQSIVERKGKDDGAPSTCALR